MKHKFQVYVTSEEKKEEIEKSAKEENRYISNYFLWLHEKFMEDKKVDEKI